MAVEFALLAPVLLLLTAGLIDGGRLVVRTLQVKTAAQAGADYARVVGWNATAIAQAVTDATPLAAQAVPAPSIATGCVAGGVIVPGAGGCAGGGSAGRYVTVRAEAPFRTLMPWPGLPEPTRVHAQAVVRIP